ncbi:MAG: ATP-binding protein, partial [Gaiellaceae bacterium]
MSVAPMTASDRLLEREPVLDGLRRALADATAGRGRLVLVAGEAGVGKTAALRCFSNEASASARVLWGACDPLFTPRPLAPFVDIARATGSRFAGLVDGGAKPYDVASALLDELDSVRPSV